MADMIAAGDAAGAANIVAACAGMLNVAASTSNEVARRRRRDIEDEIQALGLSFIKTLIASFIYISFCLSVFP